MEVFHDTELPAVTRLHLNTIMEPWAMIKDVLARPLAIGTAVAANGFDRHYSRPPATIIQPNRAVVASIDLAFSSPTTAVAAAAIYHFSIFVSNFSLVVLPGACSLVYGQHDDASRVTTPSGKKQHTAVGTIPHSDMCFLHPRRLIPSSPRCLLHNQTLMPSG